MHVTSPAPSPALNAKPLSTWAAALLIGTVLATALVLGLVIERFARHHEITRSRTALAQMGWQLRDQLDRGMAERFDEALALAAAPPLQSLAQVETVRDTLQLLKNKSPTNTWLGVADTGGRIVAATGGLLEGQNASARPWFRAGLQGPYVGDVHPAVLLAGKLPARAAPWNFVDLAAPLRVDGQVRGVLSIHLDWEWARNLSATLLVPELARSGIEFFILRADGEVLLGPDGTAGTRMDLPALRAAAAADPGWFGSGRHLDAVVATQGHGRYPGLGWFVVVRQPVELALADYGRLRTQLALATLLVVLGIGLAAPGLAQRLAHPLLQIMQWLALAQPQALRLRGRAFREAHDLAESLDALRARERQQADALRELNASLESRVAERTSELQKARHDLRSIVNALPTAVGYWDRELLNRFANEAWRDWFGLDPVTVPGWHFSAVFGAEADAALRPRLEAALAGQAQTFEHTFGRPGGAGERHALVHHIPDVVDGEVRGLYTLAHDITELVEGRRALAAERQRLRDSKAFLERVGRVSGVGGWQLDLRTGQAEWTAEMCRILGTGPDPGQSLESALERYPGAAREQVRAAVQAAIERGEPYDLEVPYTTLDGRALWVRTAGQAEYDPADPQGPPLRLLGTFQDISERHAVATALREAKLAAESANAAKSEFLANMSHEIRTPLNAVIGLSYLLEQSALDAGQKDSVAKIQAAGRSLLAVLNDVLDLAKIEARQVELESRPFGLDALLGDLRALFGAQAQAKGLALSVAEAPPGLARVVGDDTRLRQILVNLLSNALKFTEAGAVALELRAEAPRDGAVRLHFEVSDTGIGIPAEALKRLFTPFTQADAGITRRFGGTGLGLSIVHRLAALMGGRAWGQSEPGRGSRFMVTVALGLQARPGQGGQPPRVLVAGGEPVRREALAALCRGRGWDTQALGTPDAAARLQACRGAPALPDVLLLDGGAPALLADTLALHALQGSPVVVLVFDDDAGGDGAATGADTALRPHGLLRGALQGAAGAQRLGAAVEAALAAHWRGAQAQPANRAPAPQGSRALPGVRVLVVDDSGINLEVARRVLELHGAVVSTCGDGLQALQWLRAHHERCDVVLMDVQMPVMDGLEATRRLRAELGLTRLPVLGLSAGALVSERAGARAAGMDDFLAKPLEPQALVGSVRWHVEQAQGQPLPYEAQPGVGGSAPAAGDWPEIEGIDMPAVAQRLGRDRQLFRSLVGRLLREFADLEDGGAAELQRQDDAAAFAARMHRLRGSAAMLGMERLESVARALESGLREHRLSTAELQALGSELARAIRDTRAACAAVLADAGGAAAAVVDGAVAGTAATAPAALDHAALQDFLRMLSAQSLDAEQAFERLAPQLRAALGADAWQRLREAMESLEFEAARALVEEGMAG